MNAQSEFLVRSFRPADQAALQSLWQHVFPGDPAWNAPEVMIENKLRVQPELLLVGELEGSIVGALMAGFDGVRGWLYHLAVAPDYRHRGFATKLVRAAESDLRALGCCKVNLQVRATNLEVVAFYRSLGYQVEERVSMGRRIEGDSRSRRLLKESTMQESKAAPTRFEHAHPILRVADMTRSLRYYVDVLGFSSAEWGADDFTCVTRDGANIYLSQGDQGHPGTWVWLGVEDVEALHEEYKQAGATVLQPPQNFPWACEMKVGDPDGHVLRFGSAPKGIPDTARP